MLHTFAEVCAMYMAIVSHAYLDRWNSMPSCIEVHTLTSITKEFINYRSCRTAGKFQTTPSLFHCISNHVVRHRDILKVRLLRCSEILAMAPLCYRSRSSGVRAVLQRAQQIRWTLPGIFDEPLESLELVWSEEPDASLKAP